MRFIEPDPRRVGSGSVSLPAEWVARRRIRRPELVSMAISGWTAVVVGYSGCGVAGNTPSMPGRDDVRSEESTDADPREIAEGDGRTAFTPPADVTTPPQATDADPLGLIERQPMDGFGSEPTTNSADFARFLAFLSDGLALQLLTPAAPGPTPSTPSFTYLERICIAQGTLEVICRQQYGNR